MDIKPIEWKKDSLLVLDQRLLPFEIKYEECKNYLEVRNAIKDMKTRGAPVIGVTGAYGFYLGIKELYEDNRLDEYKLIKEALISSRPTAINLMWAVNRMEKVFLANKNNKNLLEILLNEAIKIEKEEEDKCIKISEIGEKLINDGDTILTHCNTGSLATLGPGTALGVIKFAHRNGKRIKVFYTETRPYLQGARLTGFELINEKIDSTLITDSMAGYVMKLGLISKVIVGADRIARNGDTANKIGTYMLSVLAKEHKIPFYIAAPTSTIDINIKNGEEIPIEERNENEIKYIKNIKITLDETKVFNPSFDVTPNDNITGIITEKGIIYKPFEENILKIF
ncbi:MAG: S-methyl-5-thioribose-1-phosphate isomerase [Caldisericia bacterium]|jgi:methylthioribose-1-phosphate isomerase|nr:S-methyl-5-thioribose-1-phosphate isomerase [Caldisericia bacterium]